MKHFLGGWTDADKTKKTKFIHEGRYAAEVEVELIEGDDAWTPWLSVQDAYKMDDIRTALKTGDLITASRYARIYELQPVTIP